MTTVGYGDFKAAQTYYIGYESFDNMILVAFILFLAIFTFTMIKTQLFSLQFDTRLPEILSRKEKEAEMFIYQIDITMKNIFDSRRKQGQIKVNEHRKRFDPDIWNNFMNTIEIE